MDKNVLISSFQITSQADSISRFSRDSLVVPETVLQHTGWVSIWLVFAGKQFEAETGVAINWGKLLFSAAIHDIDEVGTGDVPRPTKYSNPIIKMALDEYAQTFIAWIESSLGMQTGDIDIPWSIAKNKKTIEGQLLNIADMSSVVFKVWDEISRRGNFAFARVAYEMKQVMIIDCEERIKQPYAVDRWFLETKNSLMSVIDDAIKLCEDRTSLVGTITEMK